MKCLIVWNQLLGHVVKFHTVPQFLWLSESRRSSLQTHLNVVQFVAHVVHAHVVTDHGRVQAVGVRGQQLRPAEPFPPQPGRASLQAQDLTCQSSPGVWAQGLLTLPARPRRLLLVQRLRLVDGVDVEGVAEVCVGVAGLRVGDGLVWRREVRGLEVRGGRVWERRRRTVEVLTDRWQVRQPGIPIAVAIVPFLEDGGEMMTTVYQVGITLSPRGIYTVSVTSFASGLTWQDKNTLYKHCKRKKVLFNFNTAKSITVFTEKCTRIILLILIIYSNINTIAIIMPEYFYYFYNQCWLWQLWFYSRIW